MTLNAQALAQSMQNELPNAWLTIKGYAMPSAPADDQRVLFLAIARGVLKYLNDNENAAIKTITLDTALLTAVTYNVRGLDLDITPP